MSMSMSPAGSPIGRVQSQVLGGWCFYLSISLTWRSHFSLVLQIADAEEEGEEDATTKVGRTKIFSHVCMALVVVLICFSIPNMQAARAPNPLIAKHASFSAVRVQPSHVALPCSIVLVKHFFFNQNWW